MVPKCCPVCVVSPASSGCQCAPGPSASRRSSSCWSPPRTRPSTKCPSAKSPTQKPTGSTTWGWGGGPRRAGGKSRSEGSRNPLTAQELTAGAPPCAPPRAATLTDCRHPQLCSLGADWGQLLRHHPGTAQPQAPLLPAVCRLGIQHSTLEKSRFALELSFPKSTQVT